MTARPLPVLHLALVVLLAGCGAVTPATPAETPGSTPATAAPRVTPGAPTPDASRASVSLARTSATCGGDAPTLRTGISTTDATVTVTLAGAVRSADPAAELADYRLVTDGRGNYALYVSTTADTGSTTACQTVVGYDAVVTIPASAPSFRSLAVYHDGVLAGVVGSERAADSETPRSATAG